MPAIDEKFQIGETVPFRFEVRGTNPEVPAEYQELTTPDTSSSIEIFDPGGSSVVGPSAMTVAAVGIIKFNWGTTGRAPGLHCAQITLVHDGGTTIVTSYKNLEAAL
jgi:hypothetical protein